MASSNALVCIESCNFFFAGALLFSTEDIYHFSRLQHCCFIPQYSTHLSFCWLLLAPLSPFLVRVSRLITLKWDNSICKKFPIRLTWQLWDACYKADAICWGGNWTRQGSLSQKRRCNLVNNQASVVVIIILLIIFGGKPIVEGSNCLRALLSPKMGCINF